MFCDYIKNTTNLYSIPYNRITVLNHLQNLLYCAKANCIGKKADVLNFRTVVETNLNDPLL